MINLKIQHLMTLMYLLTIGAKNNFRPITTISLGRHINKSQQAASKHLSELEKNKYIKRITRGKNTYVKITDNGYNEIKTMSNLLNNSLSSSLLSFIELQGLLISGMGEGAYYMSLHGYTDQFKSKIGYIPFPGTLNIKLNDVIYLDTIKQICESKCIVINGFSDGIRTYGWVKCFKAIMNKSIDCHLIFLERTHHDNSIIELISKQNLRQYANISNNSKVTIKIPVYD